MISRLAEPFSLLQTCLFLCFCGRCGSVFSPLSLSGIFQASISGCRQSCRSTRWQYCRSDHPGACLVPCMPASPRARLKLSGITATPAFSFFVLPSLISPHSRSTSLNEPDALPEPQRTPVQYLEEHLHVRPIPFLDLKLRYCRQYTVKVLLEHVVSSRLYGFQNACSV